MKWALSLLTILFVFSCAVFVRAEEVYDQCPDQTVWVYIDYTNPWEIPCTVVVEIPKHSLKGDLHNCPAQDTKVIGEGRRANEFYSGMHVVVLKKGTLNDIKNYTTRPPHKIKVPADNINTWHAEK